MSEDPVYRVRLETSFVTIARNSVIGKGCFATLHPSLRTSLLGMKARPVESPLEEMFNIP